MALRRRNRPAPRPHPTPVPIDVARARRTSTSGNGATGRNRREFIQWPNLIARADQKGSEPNIVVSICRRSDWNRLLHVSKRSFRADQFEFVARSGRTLRLFSSGPSRPARESNYRITHGIRDRETEHTVFSV